MVPFSEMTLTDVDNDGVSVVMSFFDIIRECQSEYQAGQARRAVGSVHPYLVETEGRKLFGRKRRCKGRSVKAVLLRREQAKCCEICGERFTAENPKQIDHDHSSLLFRGILCGMCNKGLGWVEMLIKRPEWAAQMRAYLNRTTNAQE